MSPKERDDNQSLADADEDGSKPDAVEPAGESSVEPAAPDATAPADAEEPEPADEKEAAPPKLGLGRTRASGMWAGLIIAAIVLIFLLVFILQNLDEVEIQFLMFSGSLPIGVAVLLSAIAGILMVAVPGVARMIQLRRHAKR